MTSSQREPTTPPTEEPYFPPDMPTAGREGFPDHLLTACARCGYDLASLPDDAPACPECGTPIGKAWGEGRASPLSIIAVSLAGLSLMGIGCTGGFSAAIAVPGLALGLWARSRTLRGIDPPASSMMATTAIHMSAIILAIAGVVVLSFLIISFI